MKALLIILSIVLAGCANGVRSIENGHGGESRITTSEIANDAAVEKTQGIERVSISKEENIFDGENYPGIICKPSNQTRGASNEKTTH